MRFLIKKITWPIIGLIRSDHQRPRTLYARVLRRNNDNRINSSYKYAETMFQWSKKEASRISWRMKIFCYEKQENLLVSYVKSTTGRLTTSSQIVFWSSMEPHQCKKTCRRLPFFLDFYWLKKRSLKIKFTSKQK